MKKIIQFFMIMALVIAIGVNQNSLGVNAQIMSRVDFAGAANYAVYYGGYYHTPDGQADLNSHYWESTGPVYIKNAMWTVFPSTSNYSPFIEVGDIDGYVNGTYWAGLYYGRQLPNGDYKTYSYGSNYAARDHYFKIYWQIFDNNYRVVISGTPVFGIEMPSRIVSFVKVGIETNNSISTFTNGIYDDQLQIFDNTCHWQWWNYAVNSDNNTRGWKSSFEVRSSNPMDIFTN